MKVFAVLFLILGMLCSSTLAVAENPIPFSALGKNGGIHPVAIPLPDDKDKAAPTQTPQPSHMTTGGKVMTGVGIGLIAVGTLVFVAGAAAINDSWFGNAAAPLMGGGAAIGVGGTVLIIFGSHRRTTK
ncbi:MAG: hypothetical protein P4K86_11180 [Terracidiphilus sp.]|nr:hypothetical protein [Terracidiphilus sp.]